MRHTPIIACIVLLGLLIHTGCQASATKEAVDAPLLLNIQAVGLRDRPEPFDGVVSFITNLKLNKDGSYKAVEAEDLKLIFHFSVMTRQGAFVEEGYIGLKDDDPTNFVGTRIPNDKGWDVVNGKGMTIGRLNQHLDPDPSGNSGDFGVTVYGGHARRNWSQVEGYETSKAIDPNSNICCWSFRSTVTLPFGEIEPAGNWGVVKVPMWVSVYYYDIAEQRYERAHRKFDLAIHFMPAAD